MPDSLDGSVVFDRVRFRYPARTQVEALRGVDLRIEPGEVVAIVGKSGSGKSTLLNLLLRFYDPTEGPVMVGGQDVKDVEPGGAPPALRHGDAGTDAVLAHGGREHRLRRPSRDGGGDPPRGGARLRRRVHAEAAAGI